MHLLFLLTSALVLALVAATYALLPEVVGSAHKASSRESFALLTLFLGLLLPLLTSHGVMALVRRWPTSLNLPHRDYWLAPERREASLARVLKHLLRLAVLLQLQAMGQYLHVLLPQRPDWPQPGAAFWAAAQGLFLLALLLLIVALVRDFSRPPPPRGGHGSRGR